MHLLGLTPPNTLTPPHSVAVAGRAVAVDERHVGAAERARHGVEELARPRGQILRARSASTTAASQEELADDMILQNYMT